MKKTFFMVGILAALSMTAFGAEADGTINLTISGQAIEKLTLTTTQDTINFGKVLTGSEKIASTTLIIKGTTGEAVTITADLSTINEAVTLAADSDITAAGKKLTIAGTEADKATIALKYAPKKAEHTLSNATLTVTAAYDDTVITQ